MAARRPEVGSIPLVMLILTAHSRVLMGRLVSFSRLSSDLVYLLFSLAARRFQARLTFEIAGIGIEVARSAAHSLVSGSLHHGSARPAISA